MFRTWLLKNRKWKIYLSICGTILTIISIAVTIYSVRDGSNQTIVQHKRILNPGEINTGGGNVVVLNDVGHVVDVFLKREDNLHKQIRHLEKQLRDAAKDDERLTRIVNELTQKRKELKRLLKEKERLEDLNFEYRTKYRALRKKMLGPDRITAKDKRFTDKRFADIRLIDSSAQNAERVLNKIARDKDEVRTLKILDNLINETESMNNKEKKYWRRVLSVMTFEQKYKLLKILTNERVQLAALDKEYNSKLKRYIMVSNEIEFNRAMEEVKRNGDPREIKLYEIMKKTCCGKKTAIAEIRNAEKATAEFIKANPNYLKGYLYYCDILNLYDENRSYDIIAVLGQKKDLFKKDPKFCEVLGRAYLRF